MKLTTGKFYRGSNALGLITDAMHKGFDDNCSCTYENALARGFPKQIAISECQAFGISRFAAGLAAMTGSRACVPTAVEISLLTETQSAGPRSGIAESAF
jgi:hypothetical protein